MPELDHRRDDRAVVRAREHPRHEAAVDLQLGERKAAELRERRVAASEVVERDAHAVIAQPLQRARRADRVRDERRSR